MLLAGLSVAGLVGEVGTDSPAWNLLAYLALGGIAAGFVVTYVRRRTWVLDPIVLPALVAVAGSALRDPVSTVGLTMVLLLVQSLYGTTRAWAVRSVFGALSLPAALIAAPTPIGALVDVGRSVQMVPQIILVTVLTRAIYSALGKQEQAAARDALLARTGEEILAATQLDELPKIALAAAQELVRVSRGTGFLVVQREEGGLRVIAEGGLNPGLADRLLPETLLSAPASALHADAPRIRHWHVEELIPGARYRVLGATRELPDSLIDAFRTVGTQMRLGEANLRSHLELDHQANHDALTHLPTRAKFIRELIAAVDHREPGTVALLNIDLDDFKKVNDGYGHAAGDELLVQVAQRITEAGGERGVAGRLGGDEFVLLLTGLTEPAEAEKIAERLGRRLVEPMRLAMATVRVGASIGIALTEPGVKASELSRRADIAMYAAKARGKNRTEVFSADRHGAVARHRTLEDQLPYALERGELHVYYQPWMHLATGTWGGVEALLQWQHPTEGDVNCRELLELAERTGDIGTITAYFLRTVAAETAVMPGGDQLRLGVNLSPHQLLDHRFTDALLATLDECGLAPARVTLEIVESEQIDDPRARARLECLAASGVRIALDDFGTGYVSFASLRAFPIHQLKVDGSFLAGDPGALDLVLSVSTLLGTESIVQGVTSGDELAWLRETRATGVQGPHVAPILSGDEVAALLQKTATRPTK